MVFFFTLKSDDNLKNTKKNRGFYYNSILYNMQYVERDVGILLLMDSVILAVIFSKTNATPLNLQVQANKKGN